MKFRSFLPALAGLVVAIGAMTFTPSGDQMRVSAANASATWQSATATWQSLGSMFDPEAWAGGKRERDKGNRGNKRGDNKKGDWGDHGKKGGDKKGYHKGGGKKHGDWGGHKKGGDKKGYHKGGGKKGYGKKPGHKGKGYCPPDKPKDKPKKTTKKRESDNNCRCRFSQHLVNGQCYWWNGVPAGKPRGNCNRQPEPTFTPIAKRGAGYG